MRKICEPISEIQDLQLNLLNFFFGNLMKYFGAANRSKF